MLSRMQFGCLSVTFAVYGFRALMVMVVRLSVLL